MVDKPKKLKWYEDTEKREKMVENLKARYKERLKKDVTLQIKKTEFYLNWRNNVLNHYNSDCEICNNKVLDVSITFRNKTYKEMFIEHGIQTLKQAMECIEMWKPEHAILRCVSCVDGYKRNKHVV